MLKLIIFNLRYMNTKISDKHFDKIMERVQRSTFLYKLLATIATAIIVLIALDGEGLQIFNGIEEQQLQIALFASVGILVLSTYIVFTARKIRQSAIHILTKQSSKMITKTFEKENLLGKKVILTNIANGKELGFSSDAAIVAVIPKRNEFCLFEMFVEIVELNNKKYPIFKKDKSKVLRIVNDELLSLSEYFERGNYVPQPVKDKIEALNGNVESLINYGMDIDEVIDPQENTVIELQTKKGDIAFRAYKFKEILAGVYTNITSKDDITLLKKENSQLEKLVEKYKSKIKEM